MVEDPADIEIVRGNNYPPARWQFLSSENPDVLFDLTGSVFKLTLRWPGGTLARSSDVDSDLAIDFPNSILAWTYTAAQSRSLPLGRMSRYELERWAGAGQQTLIEGYFIATEGANPD